MNQRKQLLKAFGPGILFASTCIGVSHLVQSTRAGADYGFELVIFIILANLFKYPFFEFGSRYAAATGKNLLEGYLKEGKWVLWLYFIISLVSMFTVTAAVTFVTAGMLNNLLGIDFNPTYMSGLILLFCTVVLMLGKYHLLDTLLKIIGSVLLISTLVAFFGVLGKGRITPIEGFIPQELFERNGIIFLIALMGWMPTAVDLSTWNSIWAVEKMKDNGGQSNLKNILFDFNFGYIITAVLALCFLTLGAYVMYGSGEELSSNSTVFSDQVVSLYTNALGSWAYPVIAIAAFSTMFSTTITVVDGYGRSMGETLRILFFRQKNSKTMYYGTMVLVSAMAFLFIAYLSSNLKDLVDLATTFSFVVAPLIAWINYKVIMSKQIASEFRPKPWLKTLAISGLIFLTAFAIIYLIVYFLM
ncbi:NRAMP family divalent metal transporter [Roseivirga pacifica]|uniref:NRAMP family divalent metal transporter n=1 Tax=Roseivirga pacifica TaxID=1267423 RepID=UPI0020961C7B|nr:divalent metal cation transporter [Roseivirga pacifica]MCO6359873.1 divalent metal cation transporter [Roseivirga pacifica]MCO6367243.1 divalent metal cation transporter [Roseivirga pacifica]MCO6370225.1 divalent metal cation transporter [Roseivirga pacifica]MCO6374900.1 divalent metal cation transporter [Roseivirga pacifica]MCO6380158.1 divalent metal cation transporter [Roseivirga pacifica]